MSYRYAQINESGIVLSDSHLSGTIEADNMIPISDDFALTNKKYIDGGWMDYIPEPLPELISDQELLQAETLLNQCNILVNQENQDTVLAEILINQLGV